MLFNTGRWLLEVRGGDVILSPLSLLFYGVLTALTALWTGIFLKRTALPK
jgi:hypothetical protein